MKQRDLVFTLGSRGKIQVGFRQDRLAEVLDTTTEIFMDGRRIAGTVCFVLAALLLVSGISASKGKVPLDDPSGLGVSRMVGAFLPSIFMLAVGSWLFQKKDSK